MCSALPRSLIPRKTLLLLSETNGVHCTKATQPHTSLISCVSCACSRSAPGSRRTNGVHHAGTTLSSRSLE
ncbi:hypothetical protein B0H14DRAFT_2770319 [Mycena olivaceomarginata]|nr:hypothetical protein B0H14DRAFT_2770319 [Mycena olivaceomarginata]